MLEVAANILYTAGLSAKFRGKHVGPVLWCVASTRTTRRSLILLLHAFSLAHARGGSQTRWKFYYSLRLLLVPTTLVREIIILFGIYMSFSTPSIYLYTATIKKYILHLHKATNSNRDKSYYSLLFQFMAQFQNLSNQGCRWVVELIF